MIILLFKLQSLLPSAQNHSMKCNGRADVSAKKCTGKPVDESCDAQSFAFDV